MWQFEKIELGAEDRRIFLTCPVEELPKTLREIEATAGAEAPLLIVLVDEGSFDPDAIEFPCL